MVQDWARPGGGTLDPSPSRAFDPLPSRAPSPHYPPPPAMPWMRQHPPPKPKGPPPWAREATLNPRGHPQLALFLAHIAAFNIISEEVPPLPLAMPSSRANFLSNQRIFSSSGSHFKQRSRNIGLKPCFIFSEWPPI